MNTELIATLTKKLTTTKRVASVEGGVFHYIESPKWGVELFGFASTGNWDAALAHAKKLGMHGIAEQIEAALA